MKLHQALIAVAATVVTAVGSGYVVAQAGRDEPPRDRDLADTAPPSTPPATTSVTTPPATRRASSPPADDLSEENLIRERLYFDVTGHSFTGVKPAKNQTLSACTGTRTFADSLPQGVTTLTSTLIGGDGRQVVNQVAQTRSAAEARAAAEEIVTLVADCPAISGGDFGYGDPVTVVANASREIIYLPAYDSDQPAGGYIVLQVGPRLAVIDVNDGISEEQVTHLAKEAASITAD